MKKFFRRLTFLVLCALPAFIAAYAAVDYLWNAQEGDNTIFIWGDSQVFRAINLDLMRVLTGKRVLTAAQDGAGVYDFLVFAEKVPQKASVIIALSEPVQLRRKQKDKNWSGISLRALMRLYRRNYSLYDIARIMGRNLKPAKLYLSHVALYPYYDVVVMREPISVIKAIYAKKPDYLDDKQALYMDGIEILREKRCKITFIELPYHPLLDGMEARSAVKQYLDSFRERVLALFDRHNVEVIRIDTSTGMYDLTHLNIYGANTLTKRLAQKMRHLRVTTLFSVRGRYVGLAMQKDRT